MQGSVTALKAAPKLHSYNSSRNINSDTQKYTNNAHFYFKKKTYTHPKLTKGENDFLKKVLLVVTLMSWKKNTKVIFHCFFTCRAVVLVFFSALLFDHSITIYTLITRVGLYVVWTAALRPKQINRSERNCMWLASYRPTSL